MKVSLLVDQINGYLSANDDFFTVASGLALEESPLLDVLENDLIISSNTYDQIANQQLKIIDVTQSNEPGAGQVSIVGNKILYVPNQIGQHSFSYKISAGGVESYAESTVRTLSMTDAIFANDDVFTMDARSVDQALFVLRNDIIVKGDTGSLKIQSVEDPAIGSISISDTGDHLIYCLLYTSDAADE